MEEEISGNWIVSHQHVLSNAADCWFIAPIEAASPQRHSGRDFAGAMTNSGKRDCGRVEKLQFCS